MRVVLMGPPGAGKGTQAKRLVDRFSLAHLSSGDILRAERASGSELGGRLSRDMAAGRLVPDEIVVEVMAKAIAVGSANGGLLLDGFPRTVAQAEALDAQLAKAGRPLDVVVLIQADEDVIVARITGRRGCPKCGKVFHVKFIPPAADGRCDQCGAELAQRDDDREEVVRQRMAAYKRQTEPVIDYYRRRGGMRILEVDGNRPLDDVTSEIADVLGTLESAG